MDMKQAIKAAGVAPAQAAARGFFDERGDLRLELVSKESMEKLARQFDRDGLSPTQLRRFFNHCRGIERRLRGGLSSWEQERPQVAKLSAYAADAYGKRPHPKIPASFRAFVDDNVARTATEKDFLNGFMEHFEALVGFATLYLKEERQR